MKKVLLFQNLELRYKIIILFIPLIVIPLIVLGYVSNSISSDAIIHNTVKNTYNESILIADKIDQILDNAEDRADFIVRNLNIIYDQFDAEKTNDYDKVLQSDVELRDRIMSELVFSLSHEIDSLIYIDNNNQIYSTNRIEESQMNEILQSEYIDAVEATVGNNIWFTMEPTYSELGIFDEPGVLMGKKIIDTLSSKKLGTLFIGIKESTICNEYSDFNPILYKGYYIINDSGIIVSSMNKSELFQATNNIDLYFEKVHDDENNIIYTENENNIVWTYISIPRLASKLVCEIPLNQLTKDATKVTYIIIIVGMICIAIALFASKLLSDIIVKPIQVLTERMKEIQIGNFEVKPHEESMDEIGLLSSGFDIMTIRIKELLDEIKLEQHKKREYELALMQAQIKPHFLYNTLHLVYVLCSKKKYEEGMKATKSLSDFYKMVLSGGKEIISIYEEIKNVESYLEIQQIRYSDVFKYEIDIELNIIDGRIPKLTIQPFVENAIYHGLKPAARFGLLKIKGSIESDMLILRISDNGVGIETDRLLQLFTKSENEYKHFGIRNVNDRIRLYFGNTYGVDIMSVVNEGTTVLIKMPLILNENRRGM